MSVLTGEAFTLGLGDPEGDALALTGAQREIWFAEQLSGPSARYTIPVSLLLDESLDASRLADAMLSVARSRAALRTVLSVRDGRPEQTVHTVRSIDREPVATNESDAERIAAAVARQGADAWRIEQYPLADGRALLVLVWHHAFVDGWSVELLLTDLATAYREGISRRDAIAPADLVTAERELLSGEAGEAALRRRVRACSPLPEPWRPPAALSTSLSGIGETVTVTFPQEWVDALTAAATSAGVTPYVAALTAFGEVARRFGGTDCVLIGTPAHNRLSQERQDTVGMLANTVALRLAAAAGRRFAGVAAEVADIVYDAVDDAGIPLSELASAVRPDDDTAPLVRLLFGMHEDGAAPEFTPGHPARRLRVHTATAKFGMTWTLLRSGEQLILEVEYDTALADRPMVASMIESWATVLRAATTSTALDRIPLAEAASTELSTVEVDTIPAAVLASVARTPHAVAVLDGDHRWTYAELAERAGQWRAAILATGVRRGARAAVVVERGGETIAALLGVLSAGLTYLPIEPDLPAARARFYVTDGSAELLVGVPAKAAALGLTDLPLVSAPAEAAAPVVPVDPSDPAYLIYTSGSTGVPKGVLVPHSAVTSLVEVGARSIGFGAGDVWPAFHSYAFDVSVWEIWGALSTGGQLVIVDRDTARDPAALRRLLRDHRVTVLNQTPSAFRTLERADAAESDALSLRHIVFAGEQVQLDAVERWRARHRGHRMWNLYGITETTVHVTAYELTAERERSAGPIGVPMPRAEIHLLDHTGHPVAPYQVGEIHVGGHGVAHGYWGRPGLTAERFVPHPSRPGARLYRSGDHAWRDEHGRLHYAGRTDEQVKVRGFRIELPEIRAALLAHPAVTDAAVLLRRDDNPRLHAYFTASAVLGIEDLREELARTLPVHMIPHLLHQVSDIPLTENGKIDKRALLATSGPTRPARVLQPPRTEVESILLDIWRTALGREDIGVTDSFFVLGGDSISSLQVVGGAAERGIRLSVKDIFEYPTIRTVAEHAGTTTPPETPANTPFSLISAEDRALLPDTVIDAYPLASLQAGMVYHMDSDPEGLPYHNVDSFRVRGPWVPDRLAQAVQDTVARHENLRTSFDFEHYSQPLQLVHAAATLPIVFEDLRHMPDADRRARLGALLRRERRNRFDLAAPPFLRFFFARLSEEDFQWTLTEHHAIQDGWSLHSMIAEILDRYVALVEDPATPPLPPPRSRYRNYVAAELTARTAPESRAYWERLRDREPEQLLTWTTRSTVDDEYGARDEWSFESPETGRFGYLETKIPSELTERLLTTAADLDVPFKSLLLAAHLRVVGLVYGTNSPTSGVTMNGRLDEPGATETRGLFLNTLPMRLPLPDGSWADLCRAALAAEIELLPHCRYPLFEVVRQVGDAARFDVSFIYNHFHALTETLRSGRARIVDDKIDSFATDRSEPTNIGLVAGFLLSPVDANLLLALDYDTERVGRRQVASIRALYLRVLCAIADNPAAAWRDADLRGPNEPAWTVDPAPIGAPATVPELIARIAERKPDAIAIRDGDDEITYADLLTRASRWARALQARGVRRGDFVAVVHEHSADLLLATVGSFLAGAAVVFADPALPPARLTRMLGRLGHGQLITTTAGPVPDWPTLNAADVADLAAEITDPGLRPHDLAYVIHTSGSTGEPKAVAVSHASASHYLRWAAGELGLGDGPVPLYATIGADLTVTSLLGPLVAGGTVVVVRSVDNRVALSGALAAPISYAAVKATPSHLRMIAASGGADIVAGTRVLISSGEALAGEDVAWAVEAFPGVRIVNEYGPTEATVGCTAWDTDPAVGGPVSIGRPIAGSSIQVLDPTGQPAPAGTPGEVYIGGPLVAWGYLGDPARTADRFVPDPFAQEPGARLYRTGDLGRWLPDGTLDYLGRLDDQIKINGYRVEPGEIVAVLTEHPDITSAAVIVHEGHLVAYLTPNVPHDWREHAARLLPAHMVPAVAAAVPELPLTASGKLDRSRLPQPSAPTVATPSRAPNTPLEQAIADIWQDLLGVPEVGAHDDFFGLSGHSLTLMQMVVRVSDVVGTRLQLLDVLADLTVAGVAKVAQTQLAGSTDD
ncbi:amino acid adenylation domain-containing protein [Solihabitans fulvus]|uniref:Amino acid adenylation domain-containing protein n=1 Tax=Solihabitans fulvus TaxID=1892852 RepID=A0A5B2WLC4_9PSEU|nr:non-ribosomal peptide synthetase [Solihabitans fulvus]KAA2252813.1 amino acid adenylation domain-containing protein [Solihabitans fulvus]